MWTPMEESQLEDLPGMKIWGGNESFHKPQVQLFRENIQCFSKSVS